MTLLLDTHFLIWTTLDSARLRRFPWLGQYLPWTVSPVSLLELQYLSEIGRVNAKLWEFTDAMLQDDRFVIDEVPLLRLVREAFVFDWTRDPFDRLLAGHSTVRGIPLCTVDRVLVENHLLLPVELRA